jgi:hypothetical protein
VSPGQLLGRMSGGAGRAPQIVRVADNVLPVVMRGLHSRLGSHSLPAHFVRFQPDPVEHRLPGVGGACPELGRSREVVCLVGPHLRQRRRHAGLTASTAWAPARSVF